MTNSMGLKKKLLIGVLTAALCASTCAGGLLIKANAESADAADLVTATNGTTVTAAKSYTTTAGDYTTPAGLYIAAPADKSLSYGVEFKGIFTGSTGIKAYFPGEGFWGPTAQTTITVTSVADIEEKFQVHIGGEWQRYGYVTYDWNGETLYRTINSYEGNDTYYYREDNVKDVGAAQYLPIQGWMESDGGRLEPYIGFEMQADGTFNVVLISGHNAGVHKTIASFCEEKTSFEPTTEASGTEPNLPKLDLSAGYMISIENADSDTSKSFDLLIESIATSATGDPYAGGTVYTLDTATLQTAPSFYQKWQTTPFLSVGDYEYLNSVAVGEEVELPEVSVVLAGQPSAFTGTITVTDSEGTQDASNGKYTVRNSGKHTVNYTQGTAQITISFDAFEEAFSVDDVTQDVQGAQISYEPDIRNLQGITLKGTNGGFSGKLAGSFSGNMSIDFEFPQQFNDANTGNGARFTFTVYDPNGNAAFDIVYENAGGWYTAVYVKMGDNIRTFIEDGSYDGWSGDKGTMFYSVPTGDRCLIYPGAGIMYNEPGKFGTLQLVWEGNVLNVRATDRNGNLFTFAEFDGSEPYSAQELDTQNAVVLDMTAERRFGLPLMDGSDGEGVDLTHGYSVGFSSSSAELPVTFLSVNGISLANMQNLPTDYVFSANVDPDCAYVSGKDVYVAQGQHVGSVRRVYSYAFTGASSELAGSWGLSHEIVEADFDGFHSNTAIGNYTVTIPADGGEEWAGMDAAFTLHIEQAWKLSFDLKGGQVAEGSADDIVYSEHTKFLLAVPEVERASWEFDGWSTKPDLSDTWDGSFDGWAGDMTLYAKWKDGTPATVVFADGIEKYMEVSVSDGSFTISKKDVVASDAAQPEAAVLTVRYRMAGEAEYTMLEGESVSVTDLTPGKWEIVYEVSDGLNGTIELTRTVAVIGREAPVVTIGDVPSEVYVGYAVEVSATAKDADGNALDVKVTVVDANGTKYEVTDGKFTPDKAGVYTVSFTAEDGSQISSNSCYVTVVADTEAPVLSVDFEDMTTEKGSDVSLPEGTAQDNADPDVTVTVSVTFGTESVELSGNTFKAEKEGTYTVTWTARDRAGNTSTVTAHVTVQPAAASAGGNTVWIVVGIAAGVVVLAAVAAVVAVVVKKNKAKKTGSSENTSESTSESDSESTTEASDDE